MASTVDAQLRPGPNSVRRSPWLCAAVTAILATTFWMGLIWLAQRIVN
ncbi:MAG: hypothetical protein ACRETL_16275 [Gammaproteobacteria bacterium]